jgi:glycosyltransferase involved in cell wall biosynthesis
MPATAERIAFVCPRFAEGATVGGAETLLRNLAERAAAAGRRVAFLTTCATSHFTWQNERPPGVARVRNLEVHYFPVDENRDLETFLRVQEAISRKGHYTAEDEMAWLRNSVNSQALCRHLAERGADYDRIIIGPYLFGLTYFAAQIHPAKTSLLPCLHDEGFAYARVFRDLFRNVGGLIFNSEPERDLARRLYDLPESRGSVVGMGLDDFTVSADAFARRHGITAPYVIYSGRREGGKGTPLLLDYLDVFRQRTGQDIKLVLTGSGPVNPPPGLAPHILDVGFVSETEKHEAMAGAAVFCHPSVNESFGIVILESWLARTPVLVHGRCAVTRQLCLNSNGGLWFTIYPEFEEALGRLLRDDALRRALGEAGRKYVLREYAWDAIERKLLNALDQT